MFNSKNKTNAEIIQKNQKAIVMIGLAKQINANQGQISVRGTGFMVSQKGEFLTCAHVYNQIPENERQFLMVDVPDKINDKGIGFYKKYKAELVKIDLENDTALMRVVGENSKIFDSVEDKLGEPEQIVPGDEMLFLGYPLATEMLAMGFGITMNANECIISAVKRRGKDGSLHFFFIDTHTNNGSSGSPIFLKSTGEIIGIISGRIGQKTQLPDGKTVEMPANLGICVPISYGKKLLENNK